MYAENIKGEKFEIKQQLDVKLEVEPKVRKRISVAKSFRRGQIWNDFDYKEVLEINDLVETIKRWKLTDIENISNKIKKITFKKVKEKEKKKVEEKGENKEHKKLLLNLNLYKENLALITRDMLLNVFLLKDLNKLLEEDKIEFIKDDMFIYLKVGNTACRI